jgi:hypothetical protein
MTIVWNARVAPFGFVKLSLIRQPIDTTVYDWRLVAFPLVPPVVRKILSFKRTYRFCRGKQGRDNELHWMRKPMRKLGQCAGFDMARLLGRAETPIISHWRATDQQMCILAVEPVLLALLDLSVQRTAKVIRCPSH